MMRAHWRLPSLNDAAVIGAVLSRWTGASASQTPVRYRLLEDAQGEPIGDAGPLLLALDQAHWLEVEFDLPSMAHGALKNAIEIEMDRLTPFRPDEVDWTFSAKRTADGRRVRVLLAPKRFRAACGRAVEGLALRREGEIVGYIPIAQAPTRNLSPILASCALLVALVAAIAPNLQLAQAIIAADAPAAPVTQSSGRPDHPDFTPQPARALAVVTELLSDDAYLEEMQIERDRVRMSGKARDVSALLARLTASPDVIDPKVAGNITRDRQTGVNSFEISLTLVLEARR